MLRPVPTVSAAGLDAGQRALVQDLAWASLSGAFAGGVILVAFALQLGAGPLHVGLLAAIPFLAQAVQLPVTVLVERWRLRRRMAVLSITAARLVVLAMAALPLLESRESALRGLIAAHVLVCVLNAAGACAFNSWMHQLIPAEQLGRFFARRLFWGTTVACVGTLAAGHLVDRTPRDEPLAAYTVAFAIAAVAGFVSSGFLARAPEPRMPAGGPAGGLRSRLAGPLRDRNFRRVLVFLAAWTIASNISAPFLAVYLMEQRGYALATVTSLWVTSQAANALTLYLWGRLSDRLSNKAVLAVALPVYFGCVLALVFVDLLRSANAQLAVLYLIHVVMGVATGGIGLATGNLGLKLAPQGEGTVYLSVIGLATAVAGGIAPVAAGWVAQQFVESELSAVVRWTSPGHWNEMAVVSFAHWEFLFALSALVGLYVIHALWRIEEGREVSERQVVQAFALEARRSLNGLSTTAAGALFPFERLSERRKWWRAERRSRDEPGTQPEQRRADRRAPRPA